MKLKFLLQHIQSGCERFVAVAYQCQVLLCIVGEGQPHCPILFCGHRQRSGGNMWNYSEQLIVSARATLWGNKRSEYFTWWSWLEAVCMRTGLTEASQQETGKIPLQPVQHGLKASSQSRNTDTLLHCGCSPPVLDCYTRRIPEINITRKCTLIWKRESIRPH